VTLLGQPIDRCAESSGSVAYTVNAITARQTFNAYEPLNFTNEFGVKVGWHFGGR